MMKNTLRYERGARGLTQSALATMSGVTRKTISSIENGENNPSLVLALRFALIFNKQVGDIFQLERKDLGNWLRNC